MDGEPTIDATASEGRVDRGVGPGRVGIIDVGLQLDSPRGLRARQPRAAAGVQREGAVRPGARPRRDRPPQSAGRRNGARQHRPLRDARPQHEGDVARSARHRGGARRVGRTGVHAPAGEPAGYRGAYRERSGRGAILGLWRDLRHARGVRRHGRSGRRQPRARGVGPRPDRDIDHIADRAAASDVLGQGRSQEDGDRGDRERRLVARGDRKDLLCRGRRLAFLRPPAHGAGRLPAAHHPSVRHSRRRGACGWPG